MDMLLRLGYWGTFFGLFSLSSFLFNTAMISIYAFEEIRKVY